MDQNMLSSIVPNVFCSKCFVCSLSALELITLIVSRRKPVADLSEAHTIEKKSATWMGRSKEGHICSFYGFSGC